MKKISIARFEENGQIFVSAVELRDMLGLNDWNFLGSFWQEPTIYWWNGHRLQKSPETQRLCPEFFILKNDAIDILRRHQGTLSCQATNVPERFAQAFPHPRMHRKGQTDEEVDFRVPGWYSNREGAKPYILVSTLYEEALTVCKEMQMVQPVYLDGPFSQYQLARLLNPDKYKV